jgi:methyl-accepting chemotaxis protein
MPGKYKRKIINYSIKRRLQIRLFIKVLSVSIIGVGLMAVVFYFYSNREINESYQQFHIHAKNFLDYLLPAVILSLLLAFLLSVVITLFFPLRIAGPLYRIERDLKEKVGEGDLTVRFKLRKSDEIRDLADALNLSLEKLQQKIESLKRSSEKLASIAEVTKGEGDKDIKRLAKEINEAVKGFKL